MRKKIYLVFFCLFWVNSGYAVGQMVNLPMRPVLPEDLSVPEMVKQEQRLNDLKQQLEQAPLIAPSTSKQADLHSSIVVEEEPCFQIHAYRVEVIDQTNLSEAQKVFSFLQKTLNQPKNKLTQQCIGTQSLQNIVRFAQNELIRRGFITSQVTVQEQDLNQGLIVLQLHTGRIHQIQQIGPDISQLQLQTALPFAAGDLLNIKQLDQGLENLKKISGLDVDIQIIPSSQDDVSTASLNSGYSNIQITTQAYQKVNFNVSFDDSGNKATGKYIGTTALSLNNPLRMNDTLYLSYSHSLDDWHQDRNQSYLINYQLPFQSFDLNASYNEYEYDQNVAGYQRVNLYSGISQQANLSLSKMISRGSHYKTSLYGKLYHKQNRNYIEDIEIGVQHRRTSGWNAGLVHKHYIGSVLLDASLDYRHGTGALSAKPAPEEEITDSFGNRLPEEGYARAPIWSADFRISYPFFLLDQPAQYRLNWRGQYASELLVPQDRFYIGGRYSVRGFDGEIMLSGDHGHTLQQELNINLPVNSQLYMGVDQGWVSGPHSLSGQRNLVGTVIGLRSYWQGLYLDAFAGHGLVAPQSIPKEWVTGFSLNYSF